MPADLDTSPGIHAMLYRYRPSRRPGQRIISLESPDAFDRDLIEAVTPAERTARVGEQIDWSERPFLGLAAVIPMHIAVC